MYLQVLSENGVIGMTLYVLWLGSIFLGFWKVMWNSPDRDLVVFATAWFIGLAGFCLVGTVDSFQYLKITWLAAGVSIIFQQTLNPRVKAIEQ
jgi:O-antigen ligase